MGDEEKRALQPTPGPISALPLAPSYPPLPSDASGFTSSVEQETWAKYRTWFTIHNAVNVTGCNLAEWAKPLEQEADEKNWEKLCSKGFPGVHGGQLRE